MSKTIILFFLLLLLAACSVEISDSPATSPPQAAATDAPADVPTDEPGDEPAAATDQPAAEPTDEPAPSGPPPWESLELSGELVYIAFVGEEQQLLKLDLETGQQTTLFDPPPDSWLTDVAASPDGSQLVMAYAPPPPEGGVQFGFTDLYILPTNGSAEPQPLLLRAEGSETFFNVSWPLDDTIYYAHFAPVVDDLGAIQYASQVERMQVSSETVEVLVANAAWPRLSADGTLLAYVTDANEFFVSQADGSSPTMLLPADSFPAVDAPLFSPDNSMIYFSAIDPEPASAFSFWDWLLGVKVASAHSVPSDWWRMPVAGGEPERLTNIYEIGLYGAFGPDGEHIAFITAAGIQTMNPDGSGIFRLRNIAATGTVDWVNNN